jgi:hypothetical protein
MAHFAEIDDNNIVVRVLVIDNEKENDGPNFLANELGLGGRWIQTSYNTYAGVHSLGGTPLRKNFASIGSTYDEQRDAFIPQKIFNSWILNEETCQWEAPIPYPDLEKTYVWNEETLAWDEVGK